MRPAEEVKSLRSKFVWQSVVLVTIAFVVLQMSVSYLVFDKLKKELSDEALAHTQIIAATSLPYIRDNDFNGFKQSLSSLQTISSFNYAHVYHFQNDNLEFFTSYNKQGFPALAKKIATIDQYLTPKLTDNVIEISYPINDGSDLMGYVYVQVSTETYHKLKNNLQITLVIVYILMLAMSTLVSIQTYHSLTNPINQLVLTTKEVSQKRSYYQRYETAKYLELQVLVKALNTMLARTERFIEKQESTEQEVLKLNQELEDKVNQRTDALKESNQELLSTLEKLHQFQGQLVESEKMASLGDMVAGVAHEVNTPIGLGVTASTLLSDRLGEIKSAYEAKTLKSSQLKRFLEEGEENVGIIYRNLNRAADLISSFKKVAVDQSSEEDRSFKVTELIDEVILSLAPQLKLKPIAIDIDCPNNLVIVSKPGPLNQILINLIVNSIIHGFENREQGTISIKVMPLSGQLNIVYQDDGKGVSSDLRHKIFDPFITTKRGEGGSGLGLHLVYNLITQGLNGNIQFDSEEGKGVQFEINFPVIIE